MATHFCEDLLRWPWGIWKMENMTKKENEIFDEGSWVVAVESSLGGEMRPAKFSHCFIQTVPKPLLRKNAKEFYIPQVISLGPYHFPEKDGLDDDIKLLKSEVAKKMHLEIIWKGGLKSVMEMFMEKEVQEKIKASYAKEFKLSCEVCAWMIVRDACFVLEVLDRFREDEDAKKIEPAFIDSILSRKRYHPLLTEIVKDILKMENQLPLWALKKIRFEIVGSNDEIWFEPALKKFSPIKVAKGRNPEYHKESHILQLLHDYIVDRQVPASSNLQSENLISCNYFKNSFCKIKDLVFHTVTSRSIFIKIKELIFHTTTFRGICIKIKELIFHTIGCGIKEFKLPTSIRIKWLFALLLTPVFVMLLILGIIFLILYYATKHIFDILYSTTTCLSGREDETEKHVPSIGELRRGGIKFKKLEGGISDIKFKKKNSTLYLPQFKVDDRSQVILRNLIALEICSQEEQKPITRYAVLMNDLVDTSRDVDFLRLEDIIIGKLENDEEIARLWNSMVTPTEMPRYDSIDEAVESINRHHKKWKKGLAYFRHRGVVGNFIRLLLEFVVTYGSRPWWFFSGLIVLIVLVLTAVQVFCIFIKCPQK